MPVRFCYKTAILTKPNSKVRMLFACLYFAKLNIFSNNSSTTTHKYQYNLNKIYDWKCISLEERQVIGLHFIKPYGVHMDGLHVPVQSAWLVDDGVLSRNHVST